MNPIQRIGTAAVLLAAALFAVISLAHADEDGDRATRRVIAGTILAVADDHIVIDLHVADDDADDDYTVFLSDSTQIKPPGHEPEAGDKAKAVVSTNDNGDLIAHLIVLPQGRDGNAPPRPANPRPTRLCGEITALPDDTNDGDWTLNVPEVGDVVVRVTARTLITPPNRTPAVGGAACLLAVTTDEGLIAQQIQLKGDSAGGRDARPTRVEIRGTISSLPEDRSGDWSLEVDVRGDDSPTSILATPETQVKGNLAVGVQVVVLAEMRATAAGDVLVALRIQVVGKDAGRGEVKRTVQIRGTVVSVSDTAWTLDTADGEVEVAVGERTKIVGLAAGSDPTGMTAHVVAQGTNTNGLEARLIRIER
jgi:hypothetical protein